MKLTVKITILILSLFSSFAFGAEVSNNPMFQLKTPIGINVRLSWKALDQYENYWGVDFEELRTRLNRIDDFFLAWQKELSHRWVSSIKPSRLTVIIQPWNPSCVDVNDPYAPRVFGTCIDGALTYNAISIHLGDEDLGGRIRIQTNGDGSPVDNEFTEWWPNTPGCNTALGHELYHFFTGVKDNFYGMPQNPPGLCD